MMRRRYWTSLPEGEWSTWTHKRHGLTEEVLQQHNDQMWCNAMLRRGGFLQQGSSAAIQPCQQGEASSPPWVLEGGSMVHTLHQINEWHNQAVALIGTTIPAGPAPGRPPGPPHAEPQGEPPPSPKWNGEPQGEPEKRRNARYCNECDMWLRIDQWEDHKIGALRKKNVENDAKGKRA